MSRIPLLVACFLVLAPSVAAQASLEGVRAARAGDRPVLPSAGQAFRPILFGDSAPHAYARLFFPDADPDPAITTPAELLGQPVGSRLAHHAEVLPISFSGADVFLSKDPVVTPVRFADPDALRISGLLRPEARERQARSA